MTTTYAPGTPNWVDLGTTDIDGAKEFYGTTLGWTFEPLADAGEYHLIRSGGRVVAGLGTATDAARGTSWAVYFAVADADGTAREVDAQGGKVVVAPTDVHDKGRLAVFQDPAGAYFSVWQGRALPGAELVAADGAMCWAELATTDLAGAKRFYPGVLPVRARDIDVSEVPYAVLEREEGVVAGLYAVTPELDAVGEHAPPHWSVYFAVADCDAVADQALAMGATELLRETTPPGRMALMHDPQGGKFCVITPDPTFSM
ncbi:VOC family protein [Pilimelia terevasa]|nr:VOC family protein [Pilimelia terevasa]